MIRWLRTITLVFCGLQFAAGVITLLIQAAIGELHWVSAACWVLPLTIAAGFTFHILSLDLRLSPPPRLRIWRHAVLYLLAAQMLITGSLLWVALRIQNQWWRDAEPWLTAALLVAAAEFTVVMLSPRAPAQPTVSSGLSRQEQQHLDSTGLEALDLPAHWDERKPDGPA